jgi:hypothetical protein
MSNALAPYRPGKPCLTPRVAWALSQTERILFPDGQDPISIPDPDWQPPVVNAAVLAAARTAIAERARYLTPIDPERLSARIAAMLANCSYVEDVEPPALDMTMDM